MKRLLSISCLSFIFLILFNIGYSISLSDIFALAAPTNVIENAITSAVIYGGIGAFISISIIVIIYMIGSGFGLFNLTAWAKSQVGVLITGGILLLCVVVILLSLGPIAGVITGSSITTFEDYKRFSLTAADNMITNTGRSVIPLTDASYILSKYTTFTRSTTISVLRYLVYYNSKTPNAGLAPLQTVIARSMNWIARALVLLSALKSVLEAIFTLGIILLIFGIMLRFVPFTIKLGNTLIAFTLGLLIAFPFSIIIGEQIFNYAAPPVSSIGIPDPGLPPAFGVVCNPIIGTIFGTTEYGFWLIICTPICLAEAILTAGAGFLECWKPGLDDLIAGGWCFEIVKTWYYYIITAWQIGFSALLSSYANLTPDEVASITHNVYHNGLYPAVASFVTAVVVAFYSILLTIGTIRAISIALGGEMFFYGLSKLI